MMSLNEVANVPEDNVVGEQKQENKIQDIRNDEESKSEKVDKVSGSESVHSELEQEYDPDDDPKTISTTYISSLIKTSMDVKSEPENASEHSDDQAEVFKPDEKDTEPVTTPPEITGEPEVVVSHSEEVPEEVSSEPVPEPTPSEPVSEESLDAAFYIMYLIANKFNKIVFDESEEDLESEEEEEEEEMPSQITPDTYKSPTNKGAFAQKRVEVDPRTMIKKFQKNDDLNISKSKNLFSID